MWELVPLWMTALFVDQVKLDPSERNNFLYLIPNYLQRNLHHKDSIFVSFQLFSK